MLSVKGVGAVSRVGGVDRQVRVELDRTAARAAATAADISRQLRQVQQEASGDAPTSTAPSSRCAPSPPMQTADELAAMKFRSPTGAASGSTRSRRSRTRSPNAQHRAFLNGEPVVGFEIVRSRGASEVTVMKACARCARWTRKAPDLVVTEAFNFVTPVVDNYDGSMGLMYEGALACRHCRGLVLPARLARHLRLGDRAAAVDHPDLRRDVPVRLHDQRGHLLSLSLVIGILVDDAIVEIENIIRHLQMGKTPYQAAMEAADEIGLAVIATTFTLIAVSCRPRS